MHRRKAIVGIAVLLALVATASVAWGAGPWYVDGQIGDDANDCLSTSQACKTIQEAIDKASASAEPNPIVIVQPGTYSAATNGEVFPITITQAGLTLKSSAGAPTTIIDAGADAIWVYEDHFTLGGSGFTIRNTGRGGVWVPARDPDNSLQLYDGGVGLTVKDNIFETPAGQYGNGKGIYVGDARGAVIDGNQFIGNSTTTGLGTGILIASADGVTISNNVAYGLKYTWLTFNAEENVGVDPNCPGDTCMTQENCLENAGVVEKVTITGNEVYKPTGGTPTDQAVRFMVCRHTSTSDNSRPPYTQDLNIAGPVTISGNTFRDPDVGVKIDAQKTEGVDTSDVLNADNIAIHVNNIYDNTTFGVENGQTDVVDAENNWWGCNAGPSPLGCNPVSLTVDADPWLVLNISANPPSIVANGTSTSTIIADMTDNSDGLSASLLGYIPDGTQINFTTNRGSIGSLTTTNDGKAQATLTSSTTLETATVTAKAPPHTAEATDTTTVEFIAGPPHTVTLTANPTSIVANGVSTSTLTATVKDATGNAVADGTSVYFSTVLGTLGAPSRDMIIKTTTGGVATAILTSSTTPGTATVEAMADSIKDSTTVQFTTGAPHSLILTANPTTILADGVSTSTLTATVKDASGNPVADGTSVYFSTDLGIVAGPSRDMVVKTTTDGVATAVLTSTTTAGVATVEAASDGATDSIELPMLPLPPDRKKPPHRAKLPADGPVKFRWKGVPGAVEYNLEVYRKGGSWVKVIDKVLTRRRFKTLLPAGRYKWRVSAGLGGIDWGPWPSITETGQRKWFRFKVR